MAGNYAPNYYGGGATTTVLGGACAERNEAIQAVLTLSDIVERTGDKCGGFDGDTRTQRKIRRAARDALRDLPTKSNWKYYTRDLWVQTSAQVGLEVEYDHSALTAEVTDGDLPSDAEFGELLVDGVVCPIVSVDGTP